MTKNTKGGSKHKKSKNMSSKIKKDRKVDSIRKEPDELYGYGKVTKVCGNKRFAVYCQSPNGMTMLICKLKGSFRMNVKLDDYVLVNHFGFSDQAQIINVYSPEEVQSLKDYGYWDFSEAEISSVPVPNLDMPDLPDSDDDSQSDEEEDEEKKPNHKREFAKNVPGVLGTVGEEVIEIDIDHI